MKAFLLRVLLFGVLVAVTVWAAWTFGQGYARDEGYLAASFDKARLLRTAPPPRVVLVGGSNLAFGMDSPLLEQYLHRRVVNMGLFADLGFPILADEVLGDLRPGDVVALSLEYELLHGSGTLRSHETILEYEPAAWRDIPLAHLATLANRNGLAILSSLLRRRLGVAEIGKNRVPEAGEYSRKGFNASGDFVAHHGLPSTWHLKAGRIPPTDERQQITPAMVETLGRFVEDCSRRGAMVVFSFPPHPLPMVLAQQRQMDDALAALRSVPGLIVLDTPLESALPPESFYDSPYHLRQEAGEERTRRLAALLEPIVARGR